jgi:hypothetical protein
MQVKSSNFQIIYPISSKLQKFNEEYLRSIFPNVTIIGVYGTNELNMLSVSSQGCEHLGSLATNVQMKVWIVMFCDEVKR